MIFFLMNVMGTLVAPILVGLRVSSLSRVAVYSALCGIATPVALAIFNMSLFPYDGGTQAMVDYLTDTPAEQVIHWISRAGIRTIVPITIGSSAYWIKSSLKTAAEQPGLHSRWRKLRKARIALLTVSFGLVVANGMSHQFWGAVSGGPLGQLGVVGLLATAIIGLVERITRIKAGTNAAERPSLVTTDAKADKP